MAKKIKGNRVQVILECTEQRESGVPGMSRYITTKLTDIYIFTFPVRIGTFI